MSWSWPARRASDRTRARLRAALLVACALSGSPRGAVAQGIFADREYLISSWQTDQGLPENSATAMVQTPDGYLWFGTFNGLVRFDGVRFAVFDRSNTKELPSAEIVNLHLDRSKRLWISTSAGMARVEDGRFTTFTHGKGWLGDFVRFFAESAAGELFVATFDGRLLRLSGSGFEPLPAPGDTTAGVVPHVDDSGTLWAVTHGAAARYRGGAWETAVRFEIARDETLAAGSAADGGLWIVTPGRARKYRDGRVAEERPGPGSNIAFWHLFEDSSGALWIASWNDGLRRLGRDGVWRRFGAGSGLNYDSVRFTFEDAESNLWVGTSGGGLHRFKRRVFRNWGVPEGLPEGVVKSLSVDPGGRVLIGTHGRGVVRLDEPNIASLHEAASELRGAHVYSVLSDSRGRVWIGTYGHGVYVLDGETLRQFGISDGQLVTWRERAAGRELLPLRRHYDNAPQLWVHSLFEDGAARVWAGTNRGLIRFDAAGFKLFPLEGETPLLSVRALAEDARRGLLWVGHHTRGLYTLRDDVLAPAPEASELARDGVASLLADADGTLWIGTQDRGLSCLRDGRVARIGEAEGLPARGIGAIVDDGKGALWMASNRGVLRAAREDLLAVASGRRRKATVQVFDVGEGLASSDCSLGQQPGGAKDARGRLWFATIRGAAVVDPGELRLNARPPPVAVQEVWTDGVLAARSEPLMTAGAAPSPLLKLGPGAKRVEIRYAALSYSAPEKVRFRYMLEGLDDAWVDVGERRAAYFQDLAPGRYRFRVRAANEHGVWNEAGAALPLEVRPYLSQTLWFRAAALCGFVGAAGLVVWRTTRGRLMRRIERLEQQRALAREQARLASVLEATSDFVAFAGRDGALLYLNPAGRRMLGWSAEQDARGRMLRELLPGWAAERVMDEGIPAALRDGIWSGESALLDAHGRELPLSQVIAAHQSAEGSFVSTIARDISAAKRDAEQIKAALREKEVLLRELHHRVKNNLQVISSLLNLQSHKVGDAAVIEALRESRNRIRSMALVHEKLHHSESLARIDMRAYVGGVVADLFDSYGADARRIRLVIEAEPTELSVDVALPCGLLINELVSNALKHAFSEGRCGTIRIGLGRDEDGRYRLRVADDGVGLPDGLDFRASPGLGLQLVVALTEQLGGTIEVRAEAGTTVEIDFAASRQSRL
jgi:PAS domain S-box-containing protein